MSTPPPSGADTVPVVLFLGGLGRSGSTLLERMVGEAPGVCVLGETVHLWERGLRNDERCGCGQPFHACPFWNEVGELAFGGWDRVDAEAVLALKGQVDRNRHVPRLLSGRLSDVDRTRLEQYVDHYDRLHAAAAEVAGATVVVDSSKHASLAMCLARAGTSDLRIAHVVRDSQGVAHSWRKEVTRPEARDSTMPRWGPTRVSLEWDVSNLLFAVLDRLGPAVLTVRYEDLVAAPAAVLTEVLEHAGRPDAVRTAADILPDGRTVELSANHTVAGNPMRFHVGPTEIAQDVGWRDGLDRRDRMVVRTLTLPLRWHLGYTGPSARRARHDRDAARTADAGPAGGHSFGLDEDAS